MDVSTPTAFVAWYPGECLYTASGQSGEVLAEALMLGVVVSSGTQFQFDKTTVSRIDVVSSTGSAF